MPKLAEKKKTAPKAFVIVRTYSAGVHCGQIEERNGQEVVLTDARRIWHWKGANTLNEIALHGVGAGSRVSEPVSRICLTQAIEIIAATSAAKANLESVGWLK